MIGTARARTSSATPSRDDVVINPRDL